MIRLRTWATLCGAALLTAAAPAPLGIAPCVNLANYLEAPHEGDWGPALRDDDLAAIAAAGFRTVRLPVRWSAHAAAAAPFTIDPAFFARVDHIVDTARRHRLRVILNLHNYDDLTSNPMMHRARFAGLWRQIADHYRSADANLWFELLNEPHDKIDNKDLWQVLGPALAVVRASNPTRKVVVGGEGWSGVPSLRTLPLPADPNIVVTFHYYEPFAFTHQGASWVSPPPPLGRRYPASGDEAMLARDVAAVRAFADATGRPVFMGEFGAIDTAPAGERVDYYASVRSAFARAGIEGCAWGYANSFALRDATGWKPGMLRAMGLR